MDLAGVAGRPAAAIGPGGAGGAADAAGLRGQRAASECGTVLWMDEISGKLVIIWVWLRNRVTPNRRSLGHHTVGGRNPFRATLKHGKPFYSLVFTGGSSFQGVLGGADFVHAQ